jgi:hypothetical protein
MFSRIKNYLYRFTGRFSEVRDGWYICNHCAHMVWESFLYAHAGMCTRKLVIILGPPKEK